MTWKRTALYEAHLELGAKIVEFGGWEMPLAYRLGTIGEHMATRRDAAMFDVSHLGTVRCDGETAFETLQNVLTNDLNKISVGRAQYTHLLDPVSGSVTDDIIVWWTDPQGFDVMPNASNTSRVLSAIPGRDVTSERAIIAIQGPNARRKIAHLLPEASQVPHFSLTTVNYRGKTIKAAGTGYTGEDGVELYVPNEIALTLWNDLLDLGITPAGLGARDTLRLEAGLPLHGHELGESITPFQAGLGWVVAMGKPHFLGKEALEKEAAQGPSRKLVGLKGFTRQPFRQDLEIVYKDQVIGKTTSGSYSPVLEVGIALGFVVPTSEVGQLVEVFSRGRPTQAQIVKPPFVKKAYSSR